MEKSKDILEKLKKSVEAGSSHDPVPPSYVKEVIGGLLGETLDGLCSQIEALHEVRSERSGNEKSTAIHYTGIDVIVSMLENAAKSNQGGFLRLYDSVHLNDPDEGNYIVRYLPEEYAWLKRPEKEYFPHAYIASFIFPSSDDQKRMEDNLVFWRTYGKEGEGCSLSLLVPRRQLKKVLYGREGMESTIEILRPVLDSLEPLIKEQPISEILSGIVWKHLDRFRYLYKSGAHKYEDECRFVVGESQLKTEEDKEKIRFEFQCRNGSSPQVRHYYEHKELVVKELLVTGSTITLGPCVDYPYNMRYYLERLKEKANLTGPKIRISQISYRRS